MIFSSITFIYYFLPCLLIVYFIVPKKIKNKILLMFSLVFYFYGEKNLVFILLFSSLVNYIISLLIAKKHSKLFLILGLIFDIGMLLYYKYTNFFIENINDIFKLNLNYLSIVMPLGISFYTFQNISYLVDVYRKEVKPDKSLINYCTYITFFPQLIAGPIVKYKDVCDELKTRKESTDLFAEGVTRFILGLSKKVLIANTLGEFINHINTDINFLTAWLIAISFTLQIYYDFSGYSDMAIGLGKMFGFNFKENFNYPYISKSITDFWRRWHMSLSSFFKEYIYIPLGGNRVSKLMWIRNLFVVWFLTGFWHGASYTFILWGLFFGVVLLIEKLLLKNIEKTKVLSHIYTVFLILISFTIFNSNTIHELVMSLKTMFGFGNTLITSTSLYFIKSNIILLIIACIGATPIYKKLKQNKIFKRIEPLYLFLLLILCTGFLIDASYNPFLYFRF